MSQLVLTPVGTLSVFGFQTPAPYPFWRRADRLSGDEYVCFSNWGKSRPIWRSIFFSPNSRTWTRPSFTGF